MLHHSCTLSLATQATHLYPYHSTISLAIHSYLCCNDTRLRLLQHIHGYVCCNIYTVTFVATHTCLHLLQPPTYARDIVHSDDATHQPLTEFIVHIQPEPILISIHPSESSEHKLPRPNLLGHTKADYIYIFAYVYHFSIITLSILTYPHGINDFFPAPHFYTKSIISISLPQIYES